MKPPQNLPQLEEQHPGAAALAWKSSTIRKARLTCGATSDLAKAPALNTLQTCTAQRDPASPESSRPPGNPWKNFIADMRAGSRAERAGSMSGCTLRKTNVSVQPGRGWLIPEGIIPSTPRQGGSWGDRYHPRVGQEKPKSSLCPFQHLSIHAGGEAVRESSPGSIPAGREGEREKLSDSGMCSLLCHLLLAQPGANPPCSELLRTIFRDFWGGRRGVLLVVTRTKTCDSNSSVPPGHSIM